MRDPIQGLRCNRAVVAEQSESTARSATCRRRGAFDDLIGGVRTVPWVVVQHDYTAVLGNRNGQDAPCLGKN